LVIEIEPCLSFTADYSDWETGNERVIKRWLRSSKPGKHGKRPLGLFRGQIRMAPDFDAPMKLVEDIGETGLASENKNSPNKKTKVYKSGKNHQARGPEVRPRGPIRFAARWLSGKAF
jgi:hypothetical protein